MRFDVRTNDNPVVGLMYFIQFGVHEVSHIVAIMLPSLWVAMAGSIGEISFTVLFIVACIKYKSYFLAIFGALWCMLAFRSVGIYISDAQEQLLPLMGPAGDASQHDWHYILGELNLIQYDNLIGGTVSVLGFSIGIWALMFGLWLLIVMAQKKFSVLAATS